MRKADPKEVVSEETQDSDSDDECSSWLTSMIGSDGTALTNKINTYPIYHIRKLISRNLLIKSYICDVD